MQPSFHERFVTFYEAHFHRLYRFLDRLSGDAALAADIAQETFVRLYRRGDMPNQPPAWLATVALNLLRNATTTQARRRRLLNSTRGDVTVADPPPQPGEALDRAEETRRVRAALAQLPQRDRQLLLLRAEGYRYAELAAALDLNVASIGVLLARAKRAFRAAFTERGNAP